MKNSVDEIRDVFGSLPGAWYIRGEGRDISHLDEFIGLLGARMGKYGSVRNEQPTFENVGITCRKPEVSEGGHFIPQTLKGFAPPSGGIPTGAVEFPIQRNKVGILGNDRRSIHPPFKNGSTRREYTPEGAGQSLIDRSEAGILLFPADKSIKATLKSMDGPDIIPYNASPFHFFLYYAPPPNFPFALFGNNTVMFGSFSGRNHNMLHLSFPVFKDVEAALNKLNEILSCPAFILLLKRKSIKKIQLRDVDDRFINALSERKEGDDAFSLRSLKEINYSIYDVERTLKLQGKVHANLRWHINRFNNSRHRLEIVPLDHVKKQVVHLIGEWRRIALRRRGFSYVDVRSDKFGARLFSSIDGSDHDYHEERGEPKSSIGLDDVIARVLRVDGKVASFNIGFPLGLFEKGKIFAHAIGISDMSIPGLAEYAQMDLWERINAAGYRYVNDGPTWRKGLAAYKKKFVPIKTKRYYWATLRLK